MSRIPQVSLKRGTQKQSRKLASDVQQQLNSQPQSISILDGSVPSKLRTGDRTFQRTPTGIAIGIADSKGNTNPVVINQTALNNQKAPQSGTGNPTTAQFPNPGDFGWYTNTSSGDVMFVVNIAGTITFQSIDKLTGAITFAQHGNLSGAGNAHNFTDITGTITGAQHGTLGGGTLHAVATTSTAGFESAADKVQVNLIAGISTTVTDITTVGTAGNSINCIRLFINGVGSITTKQGTIGVVTGTAGATYTSVEQTMLQQVVNRHNALLSVCQTHGLLA